MSDKLEKLQKIRAVVRKYKDTLDYYNEVFLADGVIDDYEQKQIDKLNKAINRIEEELQQRMEKLSGSELLQDTQNATTEFVADAMSNEDDVVDHTLIDNIPLSKVKNSSIDGLKITVHSAFWTEKLMDMIMNDHNLGAEDIVEEIIRINKKQYKDEDSKRHAIKNYECSGSLVSVTKGSGAFELTGYTNAKEGKPLHITIYMVARGTVSVKILEGIPDKKGMQQMGGVSGAAATFVMKYSGFGKLTRALHNYMDGKDPWTGEEGSTGRLALEGIADLLTMGLGGTAKGVTGIKALLQNPAGVNMFLNVCQETIENLSPEVREELGLGREIFELRQALKNPQKALVVIEGLSNLVQGGFVASDVIEKHLSEQENE